MYPLKNYRIILSQNPTPNERRAAAFLREKIMLVTGNLLPVLHDDACPDKYEIIIGKTRREQYDGLSFPRSRQGVWQYSLRILGSRLYLTGYGVPETPPQEYTSAYRYVDDGGQGTVFAAYRFVEEILGYDFLRGDFELPPFRPDAAIPGDLRIDYTTESLRSAKLPGFSGDAIYMLPVTAQLDWNIMSFVIRTKGGRYAVIDGGHPEETGFLLDTLSRLAGGNVPVVDAWFLTHLHADHYGVIAELCGNPDRYRSCVVVKTVYHALLPREFYTNISRERNPAFAGVYDTICNAQTALGCDVVRLAEGDTVNVGGLVFRVIHTPDCVEESLLPKMNINDSSMVLRLEAGGQRILFLSDSEWICNRQLLRKHRDELPADIVQIAHHGCGNVSEECYEAIAAKKYLMQAGNHFYYSDRGEGLNSHNTGMIRTRRYLCRIGVKEICDRYGVVAFELPVP